MRLNLYALMLLFPKLFRDPRVRLAYHLAKAWNAFGRVK